MATLDTLFTDFLREKVYLQNEIAIRISSPGVGDGEVSLICRMFGSRS